MPVLQHQTCSFVALKRYVQTYFHMLLTHFLACVKYAHQHVFQTLVVHFFIFFHNKHGQSYQSSFSFLFFSLTSWLIFNFCVVMVHILVVTLILVVFLSLILFV